MNQSIICEMAFRLVLCMYDPESPRANLDAFLAGLQTAPFRFDHACDLWSVFSPIPMVGSHTGQMALAAGLFRVSEVLEDGVRIGFEANTIEGA